METQVLNSDNFIAGAGLADYVSDAGFSPLYKGHNLFKEKGVIHPQPQRTYLGSAQTNYNFIASCIDPSYLGNDAYLVDSYGRFYYLAPGNSLVTPQSDNGGGRNYIKATTDMKVFKGSLFVTSDTNIAKLDGSNLSTLTANWWTGLGRPSLATAVRHPMEVVEDTLYIADGAKIHTWDGSTSVYQAMQLPQSFYINALHIHPNGQYLIAFASETANASGTKQPRSKAYIISTVTLEFIKEIDLDDQVNGARLVAGILYVTYNRKLGYFTESGLTYVRDLDVDYDADQLGYSHMLGNLKGHLLVAEKRGILALGNLGKGVVAHYPVYNELEESSTGFQSINTVLAVGKEKIIWSARQTSGAHLLFLQDFNDGAPATNVKLAGNKYQYPGKRWVRKIELDFYPLQSGDTFTVGYIDHAGTYRALRTIDYATYGAVSNYRTDLNVLGTAFQLAFNPMPPRGLKQAITYSETAE